MLKLLIIDIDGVLTNGNKIYNEYHFCDYKEFNDKDFTAIKCFKADGIPVVALTGDIFNRGMCLTRKIPFYNAKEIDVGLNKAKALSIICEDFDVGADEVAYIGDDYYDISLLKSVGYPFCPNDAINELNKVPKIYRLATKGGHGVIVELYEKCKTWFKLPGNFPEDNL